MKTIIAQTSINNQIKIRYTDRPKCMPGKSAGDLTPQHEITIMSRVQQRIEHIYRIMLHGCKEYTHTNYIYMSAMPDNKVGYKLSSSHIGERNLFRQKLELQACSLSDEIVYFDEDSLKVVRTRYLLLTNELRSLLDIMKKSQQVAPKHSCWGKEQKPKRFTSNAKQRILEAGAAVDLAAEKDSTFILTTTVPGSGRDVYGVVSRWSGWITNRMTQVIRRVQAKGIDVYWFYVWEHQKRGALHQHWCLATDQGNAYTKRLSEKLASKWFDLLIELGKKEDCDLFKKRNRLGSWKNNPEVWQYDIQQVKKSVAAYFSKYCSKNSDTSSYNDRRRKSAQRLYAKPTEEGEEVKTYNICPSRYWGASQSIKDICKEYRKTVVFDVCSSDMGMFVYSVLSRWLTQTSTIVGEVSREFRVVDEDSGYLYAQGWERYIWVSPESLGTLVSLIAYMQSSEARKNDAIGYILDMDELITLKTFPCVK